MLALAISMPDKNSCPFHCSCKLDKIPINTYCSIKQNDNNAIMSQKSPMLDVFNGLITSKVRARILMRLFLNPDQNAYLRELAKEFEVSPSQIKEELDNMSEVGLLSSEKSGRQINYSANTGHSLFPELHSMVRKAMGMDRILDSIIRRLGNLHQAFVIDDYAEGKDSGLIDLVLVGDINWDNLEDLVRKTESYIQRKIRILVFTPEEFKQKSLLMQNRPVLLLWDEKGER